MKLRPFVSALLLGLTLAAPHLTEAVVTVHPDSFRNKNVFGIQFSDTQQFYGRVQSVNSISIQEYKTSAFRVTEMVVDMADSPLQLRIYYTELIDFKKVAEETVKRVGGAVVPAGVVLPISPPGLDEAANKAQAVVGAEVKKSEVVKEYPVTTHARTIEFKVEDKETLLQLYDEMLQRWLNPGAFVETNRSRSTTNGGGNNNNNNNGNGNNGGNNATQEKVDAEKRTLHGTLFKVR